MIDEYSDFDYPEEESEVEAREVDKDYFAMMFEGLAVFGEFVNEAKTLRGLRIRHWAMWRVVCPTVINHETQTEFAKRIGVSKKHVNNYVAKVRKIKARVESGDLGKGGGK